MLALVLIGIGLLPVLFVKMSPGPVYDVLGQGSGGAFIEVSGVPTYRTNGQLDMLTVTERGGPPGPLTLPEAYWGWIDPDQQLISREKIYPPDRSDEESEQIGYAQFSQSESNATAAALRFLNLPVISTATVQGVLADGPAAGVLRSGDDLLRVDSTPVVDGAQVSQAVKVHPPGSKVVFEIERDESRSVAEVILAADPEHPSQGRAGILVATRYSAEFPIEFRAADVGGPSAGLVLALGLVDKLTPESLTGGRTVAVTGTIDADGRVGVIGGVREKAVAARNAGAQTLLIPSDNCSQLADLDLTGLEVAPVVDLREAVAVLRNAAAGGGQSPRCG